VKREAALPKVDKCSRQVPCTEQQTYKPSAYRSVHQHLHCQGIIIHTALRQFKQTMNTVHIPHSLLETFTLP